MPKNSTTELAVAPDPRENADWFRELSDERKAEFREAWRAPVAQSLVVEAAEKQRVVRETLAFVAIYLFADFVCSERTLITVLCAAALGAVVGLALALFDLARLSSGALGLAMFFVFELLTRGGLSPIQMLVLFPVGSLCAYVGYWREERGTG